MDMLKYYCSEMAIAKSLTASIANGTRTTASGRNLQRHKELQAVPTSTEWELTYYKEYQVIPGLRCTSNDLVSDNICLYLLAYTFVSALCLGMLPTKVAVL
uniref:Ovule protein n=1 Tax=Heterorhabditis bacteriophora TaxID=37862 RepID=A0A1I7WUX0_HETBA